MPSASRTEPPVVAAPAPPTRCRSAYGSSSRWTASAVAGVAELGKHLRPQPSSANAMNDRDPRRAGLGQAGVPLAGPRPARPASRSSTGHLRPRQGGHRVHPGRLRCAPTPGRRVRRRWTRPRCPAAASDAVAAAPKSPAPLGDGDGLLVQRAGLGEAAPAQRDRHPSAQQVQPRHRAAQCGDDRLDGGELGLRVRHPPGLQQRVEAPQPAPQHVLRVAGAFAEGEQAAAEHEPLGVAVGARPRELPRPQRDGQRRRVVEPLGHGQRRRARVASSDPGIRREQRAVRDLGQELRLERAVALAEAAQRLRAPAAHRVEPLRLADLGQPERRAAPRPRRRRWRGRARRPP